MTAEFSRLGHGDGRRPKSRKRFEKDRRFLKRIAKARKSLRAGRGVKLENIK